MKRALQSASLRRHQMIRHALACLAVAMFVPLAGYAQVDAVDLTAVFVDGFSLAAAEPVTGVQVQSQSAAQYQGEVVLATGTNVAVMVTAPDVRRAGLYVQNRAPLVHVGQSACSSKGGRSTATSGPGRIAAAMVAAVSQCAADHSGSGSCAAAP